MSEPTGPDKLSKFLERNGISRPKFADALDVSAIAARNWLLRLGSPRPDHRKAISVFTGGEVAEDDWVTDEERAVSEKLSEVKPFSPTAEGPSPSDPEAA